MHRVIVSGVFSLIAPPNYFDKKPTPSSGQYFRFGNTEVAGMLLGNLGAIWRNGTIRPRGISDYWL